MSSPLQIHVVRVSETFRDDTPDDSTGPHTSLEPYLRYVDVGTREDVQTFRFLRDARRCLLGRLLVRHVVSTRLGKDWSAFGFCKSPRGRPHLEPIEGVPALDFNVSHDHDLVAVASYFDVGNETSSSVGIDVMKIENPSSGTTTDELIEGLSEQLHRQELAALQALADSRLRLERILAIWTLKEAFIKATGEGLHFDLRRLNVRFDGIGRTNARHGGSYQRVELDGKALQGWHFELRRVDLVDGKAEVSYWLAVAVHDKEGVATEERNLNEAATRPRFVELAVILSNAKSLP